MKKVIICFFCALCSLQVNASIGKDVEKSVNRHYSYKDNCIYKYSNHFHRNDKVEEWFRKSDYIILSKDTFKQFIYGFVQDNYSCDILFANREVLTNPYKACDLAVEYWNGGGPLKHGYTYAGAAKYWFDKAAHMEGDGAINAQVIMGAIMLKEKEYDKAKDYYQMAIDRGYEPARALYDQVGKVMVKNVVKDLLWGTFEIVAIGSALAWLTMGDSGYGMETVGSQITFIKPDNSKVSEKAELKKELDEAQTMLSKCVADEARFIQHGDNDYEIKLGTGFSMRAYYNDKGKVIVEPYPDGGDALISMFLPVISIVIDYAAKREYNSVKEAVDDLDEEEEQAWAKKVSKISSKLATM